MGRRATAILLVASIVLSPAQASDTGPEYLEQPGDVDAISSGFILFQLPFEEAEYCGGAVRIIASIRLQGCRR